MSASTGRPPDPPGRWSLTLETTSAETLDFFSLAQRVTIDMAVYRRLRVTPGASKLVTVIEFGPTPDVEAAVKYAIHKLRAVLAAVVPNDTTTVLIEVRPLDP